MKRRIILSITTSVIILILASTSHALLSADVQKAKEFMVAKMYPQAIALLNYRINVKPTDAEAHFQLGICYIAQDNFSGADQRFESAVALKSGYKYKIGGEYKKAGIEALNKGRISQAKRSFGKAVNYQPNLKADIAKECFSAGEKYLNQHQSNAADELLFVAVEYDDLLGEKKKKITREYGEKLLDIAKDKPKKERKKYVDEAKKYLTQEDINVVLPPPTWKTVFQKKYFGIGYTGGNDPDNDGTMYTLENGKDCEYGDEITISGENAEVWYSGRWDKIKDESFTFVNKLSKKGARLSVRAPQGEEFTIKVQRLTSSY